MLRPSKDHQTVIEQQPDPSLNVTKERDLLIIPGDDDMLQHISTINKLGTHVFFFGERKMSSNMRTRNHA